MPCLRFVIVVFPDHTYLLFFTLSVFAMMVYVSGINERFNQDIDKTHNKNQYIYQSTYSIKDIVRTTSI